MLKLQAEPFSQALPPAELGEGPLWDPASQTLYWVDIEGRRVHSYNLTDRRHRSWLVAGRPAFLAKLAQGEFVLGMERELYLFKTSVGVMDVVARLPEDQKNCRMNDAKCDSRGRLWVGTMAEGTDEPEAALFKYEGGAFEKMVGGLKVANGLGWSPDESTFYHTDTQRSESPVLAYDYDIATGALANARPLLQEDRYGLYDGMTVDSLGNVYCARWGDGKIDIYSSEGKINGEIRIPAPQVTSCCFGGADLRTLFVTTACKDLPADQQEAFPFSGALFCVQLPIAGANSMVISL